MPEIVAEYIDRLATIEMRPGKGNLPRGVMHRLYEAARLHSGRPLVYGMATALTERVKAGDSVLVLTGAGDPAKLPNSEVDGILGSVAIARALLWCLGAKPIIVTEARSLAPVRATVRAAGLNFREIDDPDVPDSVAFDVSPVDRGDAMEHSSRLFDTFDPAAVIAVEKLAPNKNGVIHNITGGSLDDTHTKSDVYIDDAHRRGVLTCGIGDGGNEVGFGLIADVAASVMPAGKKCQCPCGGGSTTVVATDELLVAAISDWGGYALNAMISYLVAHPRSLMRPEEVEAMLAAAVNAGSLDGVTCRPTLSDDGVGLAAQKAYTAMLFELVERALSDWESPAH